MSDAFIKTIKLQIERKLCATALRAAEWNVFRELAWPACDDFKVSLSHSAHNVTINLL